MDLGMKLRFMRTSVNSVTNGQSEEESRVLLNKVKFKVLDRELYIK